MAAGRAIAEPAGGAGPRAAVGDLSAGSPFSFPCASACRRCALSARQASRCRFRELFVVSPSLPTAQRPAHSGNRNCQAPLGFSTPRCGGTTVVCASSANGAAIIRLQKEEPAHQSSAGERSYQPICRIPLLGVPPPEAARARCRPGNPGRSGYWCGDDSRIIGIRFRRLAWFRTSFFRFFRLAPDLTCAPAVLHRWTATAPSQDLPPVHAAVGLCARHPGMTARCTCR